MDGRAQSISKHAPRKELFFLLGRLCHRAPDENGAIVSTGKHVKRSKTLRIIPERSTHPLTSPTSKLVHNVDHSANYPYGNKLSESAKSKTASTPKPQRRIRKRKSQTNPHNVPTAPPPIQNPTHRNPDKTHSTGARIPEKQTIFRY